MNDPELQGQAKQEWDKLEQLVEIDVRAQIEVHREKRTKTNGFRGMNGLPQI